MDQTPPPVLDIKGLSLEFVTPAGPVRALRSVDLMLPRGKILGVVGESGSGKSSLGLAIMGLLPENGTIVGGEARFAGTDLITLTPSELRALRGQQVSMVFQDPMTSLNPVRSIGRQMVDIQFRETALSTREKRVKATAILNKVGIADAARVLTRNIHELSGGMRQRVAIAMSLLLGPELLIADEPTTALDVTMEAQILHLLRELRSELNTSILLISHNLGAIAEICDDVVVLYAGEVVEAGPVSEIFNRPRHPYTRALLDCDPARLLNIQRELPTVLGEVPSLVNLPQGCIFESRCDKRQDRCASEHPEHRLIANGRWVRCHFPISLAGE